MLLQASEFNDLWPAIYIYSKSFNNKSEYNGLVTLATQSRPNGHYLSYYCAIFKSLTFHLTPPLPFPFECCDSIMNLKLECISTHAFQATVPLYLISFHVNYDNGLWYYCRMRMLKLAADTPSEQYAMNINIKCISNVLLSKDMIIYLQTGNNCALISSNYIRRFYHYFNELKVLLLEWTALY
jgi:hypothetical protein